MKILSKQELYAKRKKEHKVLSVLTPIVFWFFIALFILLFSISIKHSIGNAGEIIDLLDSKKYSGQEISQHYQMLIDKYGEMIIGDDSGGFTITFVNLKNAIFGSIAILSFWFSIFFLLSAFALGKWLLPYFKEKLLQDNQDMVNEYILENK